MTENAKTCALIFSTINKITWLIKKVKLVSDTGKKMIATKPNIEEEDVFYDAFETLDANVRGPIWI